MSITSLQKFVSEIDFRGDLIRIKEFTDPVLEIAEIADRIMKLPDGGNAILFENTGTDFPVLINHYGSDKRMLLAIGMSDYSEAGKRMQTLMESVLKSKPGLIANLSLLSELKDAVKWIPKKISNKGKCQEVIIENPDLSILPVLKCWPHDGGRFFTLPIVITHDPENGNRNIGMYRMQILDDKTTGMHWHLHKGGAAHFNKYKSLGKNMPVSVVLGGDPVLTYCATAPLPENIDELILAGFLKNENIKLVKSITNDIYVPENSDFVIEGYIDTSEDFVTEGPFGDHTGFYSLADKYPTLHVTCITHRKDAIFPATIVGVPPMEDFYLGKASERIFLKPIQIAIAPEIIDIRLPNYGVAHNLVLVKTKTEYAGQNFKIMNALLGAGQMMFSKVLICFNDTIDIHNDSEVLLALLQLKSFEDSVIFSKGPTDVLDHSSYKYTFGGKMLIDASEENKSDIEKSDAISYVKNKIHLLKKSGNNNNYKQKAIEIAQNNSQNDSRIIIVHDSFEDIPSPEILAWYVLNNIDPSHDCSIVKNTIILDASRKSAENNGFNREWPNVVCMDDKTIEYIDEHWQKLTGHEFVPSPSIKIRQLFKGNSAIYNQ